MAKKGFTPSLLFQLPILGGAIVCGLAGRDRLKPPSSEVPISLINEMISYSQILTERVGLALAREKALIAEGLDEEVYLTVDARRNAMIDWLELRPEMQRVLTEDEFLSIATFDITEHHQQLHDQLQRIAGQRASHFSAYFLLGASGLLF